MAVCVCVYRSNRNSSCIGVWWLCLQEQGTNEHLPVLDASEGGCTGGSGALNDPWSKLVLTEKQLHQNRTLKPAHLKCTQISKFMALLYQ